MHTITCSKCGKVMGAVVKKPPVKMMLACSCGNKGSIQSTKSTTGFTLSKSTSQKSSPAVRKHRKADR